MYESGSAILDALYHGDRNHAGQLAQAAAALTVWEAAALGRDGDLRGILAADPALANAPAPDGHTPLGLASFFGPPSTVRLLLDHGAAVGTAAANAMRVQPLHAAVAAGHAESARLLLERGADVAARQQGGYTPLIGAAAAGREDFVDLLLAYGADPAAASEDGTTAAAMARSRGHLALAERLERVAGAAT